MQLQTSAAHYVTSSINIHENILDVIDATESLVVPGLLMVEYIDGR